MSRRLWGPLGWMTLHSVSLIYPENPTDSDKITAKKFLEAFTNTITCSQCQSHFLTMKKFYEYQHPDFLNSRHNFAMFVFRAHNTVNKRLDKPVPATVAECLQTLKIATTQTSLPQFRLAYLEYIRKNWAGDMTGDGMFSRGSVNEMIKINNEYWIPRDIPIPELEEDNVLIPIESSTVRLTPTGNYSSVAVGFIGGRLRLAGR